MTSKTKLCVPNGDAEIPIVSPSLMPFRIAYTGPAPVSTYFLTKPYIDASEKRRLAARTASGSEQANQANNGDNKGSNEETTESALSILAGPSSEAPSAPFASAGMTGDQTPETSNRLQAAFRGRKVVSHAVQLPEGYTGLLLTQRGSAAAAGGHSASNRNDAVEKKEKGPVKSAALKAGERAKALKAKAAAKLKASGKGSRRSPRKGAKEMDDEVEEELEPEEQLVQLEHEETETGQDGAGEPSVEEKIFEVAGKFQIFTLWHPDSAADGSRDEYARSLNEWIALAGEIHRV